MPVHANCAGGEIGDNFLGSMRSLLSTSVGICFALAYPLLPTFPFSYPLSCPASQSMSLFCIITVFIVKSFAMRATTIMITTTLASIIRTISNASIIVSMSICIRTTITTQIAISTMMLIYIVMPA